MLTVFFGNEMHLIRVYDEEYFYEKIANSNIIEIIENQSRKRWMLEMCDNLIEFYPKEIEKIGARIEYFKKVRKSWEKRK